MSAPAPMLASTTPAAREETAFAEWKALAAKINAPDYPEDQDAAEIAKLDELEIAIMNSAVATPRIAEMRLWIGLHHTLEDPHMVRAIECGDIDVLLTTNRGRDWSEKFIVNALAALIGRSAVG